ncbi:MAG: 30S ribosomal protein S6 [Nitrospirales bacterium]|nr:30S ribosomal protein S6 [Nitrospira sp.]MDR4500442.1 30S ribosomal protein S6 [Nitrospirales bacterium]
MKIYESVCILSPSLPDDDVSKLIEKISETIVRAEASVLHVINEGKKKLAYDVQHERRGTYLIIQFQGKGNAVNELERFHRMEDGIMKFLTVEIQPELLKSAGEKVEKAEVGAGSADGRVQ